MNRFRFLVAVLALGGLLGAAEVRSASKDRQDRMEEFWEKAMQARRAQKLDKIKNRPELFAKYPTPEVKLQVASEADLPGVAVGTETTITATGRFLPGSLAHVECLGA